MHAHRAHICTQPGSTHIAQAAAISCTVAISVRCGPGPPQQLLPCAATLALLPGVQGCLQAVHARVDAKGVAVHVEACKAHGDQAANLGGGKRVSRACTAGVVEGVRKTLGAACRQQVGVRQSMPPGRQKGGTLISSWFSA